MQIKNIALIFYICSMLTSGNGQPADDTTTASSQSSPTTPTTTSTATTTTTTVAPAVSGVDPKISYYDDQLKTIRKFIEIHLKSKNLSEGRRTVFENQLTAVNDALKSSDIQTKRNAISGYDATIRAFAAQKYDKKSRVANPANGMGNANKPFTFKLNKNFSIN